MQSFREWLTKENADGLGPMPGVAGPRGPMVSGDTIKDKSFKPWRASKDDIIQHWNALRPDTPIVFDPINHNHKGSTFGEDGVRLTGSKRFIDSILGRLKDVLAYEGPSTKLDLVYRQTQYKGTDTPDKASSFVFYIMVREKTPDVKGVADMLGNPDVDAPPLPGMPPKVKVHHPHKTVEPEIGDDSGGSSLI